MGLFGKKRSQKFNEGRRSRNQRRNGTTNAFKNENDIGMVKKIKDLTNMSTGQAKELFLKFRDELTER